MNFIVSGVVSGLLIALLVIAFMESDKTKRKAQKTYTEESYTLQDGTPCTILYGGKYSGIMGVSCNYD